MRKATVVFDVVRYRNDPGSPAETAYRHDEIELTDSEYKRLADLGAIGSASDAATAEQQSDPSWQGQQTQPSSEEALNALTKAELKALAGSAGVEVGSDAVGSDATKPEMVAALADAGVSP